MMGIAPWHLRPPRVVKVGLIGMWHVKMERRGNYITGYKRHHERNTWNGMWRNLETMLTCQFSTGILIRRIWYGLTRLEIIFQSMIRFVAFGYIQWSCYFPHVLLKFSESHHCFLIATEDFSMDFVQGLSTPIKRLWEDRPHSTFSGRRAQVLTRWHGDISEILELDLWSCRALILMRLWTTEENDHYPPWN